MTVEEALAQATRDAAGSQIRFARDFQGFPGTVHGGAVAALFVRLTLPRPPVHLALDLLRAVPTDVPLALRTGSVGTAAKLALMQGDRPLAEATLSRGESCPPPDLEEARAAWALPREPAESLPGTTTCLACGSENPLGAGVRFQASERLLWQEVVPPAHYRGSDGAVHPALATVLLDELGWWLGALAQRECGVTTEVAITLLRALPWGPLVIVGDRRLVRGEADGGGRFCQATGHLFAGSGELLAVGQVRFAGSRAYTRRLLDPFLETTPVGVVARLFPSAGDLARRRADGAPGP